MKPFIIGAALIVAAYVVLCSAIAITYVIGVILTLPVRPKKRKKDKSR